jgi:hypothetical protein
MKTDKHPPKPQRRVYPDELKGEAVQIRAIAVQPA